MISWVKVLVVFLALFLFQGGDDIRYFQPFTVPISDTLNTTTVSSYDSLSEQEIFQVKTVKGTPLYYYIELNTGVCFDNKCRPLSILVYWNITGRYLGFELLDEEFLSKYDHEPFTTTEYELLDSLLANPFLPLNNYSFYDLVDTSASGNPEVDGVSSATSQDVLDYIVSGAAYTTHKLWNVVHGSIQHQVILHTEKQLDSPLLKEILKSPDLSDRTWALERIGMLRNLDESIIDSVIDILFEDEYFQSYLVLRSLNKEQLNSELLQLRLFDAIGEVDSGVEHMIFDKLMEADNLSEKFVEKSIAGIQSLSEIQLVKWLKVYEHHGINSPGLCDELGKLGKIENTYVHRQVLNFLGSTCE